ncbi:MAG: EAL domain-containing protein [Methylobacteriaceae bacterium]|nr:EAL domain-containing protein [Methylobacteriaceae bacterium]
MDALRRVLDAVPHPIFVKDEGHRFVVLNESMCELMGRAHDELVGRTDHDFVPKEHADVFLQTDRLVLDTGQINQNEEFLTDGQGDIRTIVTRKKRVCLANGARLVIGCISDISSFRRAEEQIRHHAEHDHLTGLANRALFYQRLQSALEEETDGAHPTAVVLVDLDGFKGVNDALGHAAGDELLIRTAAVLADLIGPFDLASRLGGDEFAIIQRAGEQPMPAEVLAASAIERLSQPMLLGGRQVVVSASVGIAHTGLGGESSETLMRHADLALYRAKQNGKNTWRVFEPEMEASYLAGRFLEDELRRAVERKAFTLVYQPFVRTSDLETVGFEALLRWNPEGRRPVPPVVFIPLAERLGLIGPLGEWVLQQACLEAASWSHPHRISVNVSLIQFDRKDLPMLVRSIVEEAGIDPDRIELEVNELAIIDDISRARRTCEALREFGIHFVLNGFGAGYSSLRILKSLPFEKIKIDRSLLRDVGRSAQADAIVCAVLNLARTLGLRVTAEGVEAAEQLALLQRQNCDEAQGFLIGRPMAMTLQPRRIASRTLLSA